jgi:ACS family hexuronate transporter-like MFS transporter
VSRRWGIAALLAAATALSYLDRQSFPVVAGEIRKQIPLGDAEFARIGSLFLLTYGVMYAVGGRLLDVLGTRFGYALMILWWSAADFATGLVSSVVGLGVCRLLLGMGEGGGFPGAAKAVAEHFSPRERSFAFGLFNTGSSLGAVIALPALAAITAAWGWRWVFFVTGAVGFVWVLAWLRTYPDRSATTRRDRDAVPWLALLRSRPLLGLMLAKVLTDSIWYFLIFWLPKYLIDARGFDLKRLGGAGWIPYALAGAGSFFGGALGTALIARGVSLDGARKWALGVGAAIMPCTLLVGRSSAGLALALLGLAMFAHQFWSANMQTLAADVFPARVVGSVGGLLGAAGALGGAGYGLIVGAVVASHGYALPLALAGLLHPLAFVLILVIVRRIEPAPAFIAREATS